MISFKIRRAISAWRGESSRPPNQVNARVTVKAVTSLMLAPLILTARASLRSRAPPQSGQGLRLIYCSISSLTAAESVSA